MTLNSSDLMLLIATVHAAEIVQGNFEDTTIIWHVFEGLHEQRIFFDCTSKRQGGAPGWQRNLLRSDHMWLFPIDLHATIFRRPTGAQYFESNINSTHKYVK